MADCLFCGIAAADIPATIVSSTARTIAFRDINPQAPVHVLVIPRAHHASLAELAAAGDGLLADLAAHAHQVAADEGIARSGYRVVFNTGADGGQTVGHVHAHVLGGPADVLAAGLTGAAAGYYGGVTARAAAAAGKAIDRQSDREP